VAQPTEADNGGGGVGGAHGQGLLDGVVGREASVGQWRGVDGVKVAERDEQAGVGHQHELGHAAVAAEPVAA
jgi:poly(3-hydroxybutyrate) depolymerase